MNKIDFEALRKLLGSWEKVRQCVLDERHDQRFRTASCGLQFDDELMPQVLELVMSPVQGKPYQRRLAVLIERQKAINIRRTAELAKAFGDAAEAIARTHADIAAELQNDRRYMKDNPTMSKRTRRRLKRQGKL